MKVFSLRINDQFSKTYRLTACPCPNVVLNECRSFLIGRLLVTTFAISKILHVEGDPRFREDDVV